MAWYGQAPPTTEAEVFLTMFDYIDRLFEIVRPRKMLVMAIGKPLTPSSGCSCLELHVILQPPSQPPEDSDHCIDMLAAG